MAGWQILKLGGSGAVTGIDCNSDGTKAIRCDSGGGYKYNGGVWTPIVTVATMPAQPVASLIGVYELRIAPSNSSRWWMFYGGYVFRSDNAGGTWTNTTIGSGVFTQTVNWFQEANLNQRGDGFKLMIDPHNADICIACTSCNGANGAFYTLNAGSTWVAISTVPAATGTTSDGVGTGMIGAYDPASWTSGNTPGAYIFSYGNGLYHTTTGPSGTWSLVGSTPARRMNNIVVAANGKVFLTNGTVGGGVNNNTLDVYNGSWSTVTATSVSDALAVTVDPANSNNVWVVDRDGAVSYSSNNGVTFSGDTGAHTVSSADIPWIVNTKGSSFTMFINGASFGFDPSDGTLWGGYGLGIAHGTAITSAVNMAWVDTTVAIEESISNRIIKPTSSGKPIGAIWDQGVFQMDGHSSSYPSGKGVTNVFNAAWDVDYCPTSASVIVARLNFFGTETSGKSTDGGSTWNVFTGVPATNNTGGMIACGTDSLNYVQLMTDNGAASMPPYYTTDGGATWNAISISGVSSTGPTGWSPNYTYRLKILCSDRVQTDTFYMYNLGAQVGSTSNPGVYKSTNKGVAWTLVHAGNFPGSTVINAIIKAVPGQSGNLFYTCGGVTGNNTNPPPQRSSDSGTTWTALTTTDEVFCFGFGKAKPGGGGYPAIFIAGYVSGTYGIYRSDDSAATWNQIGINPLNSFDSVIDITGDMDVYGDCYIALAATGFMYFDAGTGTSTDVSNVLGLASAQY